MTIDMLFDIEKIREATIGEMERPDGPLDDLTFFEIGRALHARHPHFAGATQIQLVRAGWVYQITLTAHEQGE